MQASETNDAFDDENMLSKTITNFAKPELIKWDASEHRMMKMTS